MNAHRPVPPKVAPQAVAGPSPGGFFRSLAGRMLGLAAGFVFLAEVLIFAPSLAAYHENWLQDRVSAAQIAALALEAAPDENVTDDLRRDLLARAGVQLVALKRPTARELLLSPPAGLATAPDRTIDLRSLTFGGALHAAAVSLLGPANGSVLVIEAPQLAGAEFVEIVVSKAALQRDLRRYAWEVFVSTAFVSLIVAALLYATLLGAFVRPMRELTLHIEAFRRRPEDESIAIRPSGRQDEIGRAETAIAVMEDQLRAALRQRERLASLGATVAKLAHDLRANLATAQLLSERLAESDDPSVRKSAPRLARAIERAAGLAAAAVRYGKAEEPPAKLQRVSVRAALDEAAFEALAPAPQVVWRNGAADGVAVTADPDLLHRVLSNLIRNAAEALARQPGRSAPGSVAATATPVGDRVLIRVVDDGPGLPEAIQKTLFQPFSGSGGGGAGLGLAIARELARAQGGDLALVSTSAEGAAFELSLPTA